MSKRDYYEILEVTRTANDGEIKSAYRKLAMKFHPDRNPGDAVAEERFKEAAEAYAVLADTEKRARYDRFGHAGVSAAAGARRIRSVGLHRLRRHPRRPRRHLRLRRSLRRRRRRGGPQRGADLRYDLEIAFEESARGAETTIQIPRQENCETCNGSGAAPGSSPTVCPQCRGQGQVRLQHGFLTVARTCPQCRGNGQIITKPCQTCRGAGRVTKERKITVKIPPGIATGQQLRLQGEGEGGSAGGPAGHLYVVVHVREHEFFRRDGINLFCEIPVNFTTLALGGEIQVPTLDGIDTIKVPEGTQTGTTLRLRGKGMPDVNGRGKGDLFATVQVLTPKKLTKEQRQLLEQLAKVLPKEKFEPRTHEDEHDDRNLFDRVKDMFG